MIRTGTATIAILLLVCFSAQGGTLTVSVPDIEVPYGASSHTFTVSAEFDGSHDVYSYALAMHLDGRDGATGVAFDNAKEAVSDYVFADNFGWLTLNVLPDTLLWGDDSVNVTAETIADTTKNLIEVTLALGLTSANIGDKYDVTFDTDWSDMWGPEPSTELEVTWDPGVITVVPEPSTVVLALAGLAAAAWFARSRRRVTTCA